jgi:hypothetical protein
MKRKTLSAAAFVIALIGATCAVNYFMLSRALQKVIETDARNAGVLASARYAHYLPSSSIVFDLQGVGPNNSMLDVTRVLLQYAQAMKARSYDEVTLAYDGTSKFKMDGAYFHQLGLEFDSQNPVYTIRTLPEHLRIPDGSPAFEQWTGGWLGVVSKQMEDFSEFHKRWYLAEMTKQDGDKPVR